MIANYFIGTNLESEEAMKFLFFSSRIKVGLQITLLLAILLFNFGPAGTSITYAAPPANDDFASATSIVGISYTNSISLNEATQDVTDPDNIGPCDGFQLNKGNNSVWYKYTPGVNESLAVDTIGSTFAPGDDLDTFIGVWTGTEGNLNLVECDDDNLAGQTSELSFVAIAGTTYYFEVAVFNCFVGDPPNCGQQVGGNLKFNINITNTNVYIGGALKG